MVPWGHAPLVAARAWGLVFYRGMVLAEAGVGLQNRSEKKNGAKARALNMKEPPFG